MKRASTISVISTATLTVTQTIALPRGSAPYGAAMLRGANAALVALEGSGSLMKLDAGSGAVLGSVAVGANPRHVAVSGDGASAYVSRFVSPPLPGESTTSVQTSISGMPVGGELIVVNPVSMAITRTIVLAHNDAPDAENQGRGIPNYLGAAVLSPDGTQAFVPSKQDNVLRSARDGCTELPEHGASNQLADRSGCATGGSGRAHRPRQRQRRQRSGVRPAGRVLVRRAGDQP
jgi:DNA-binding beta-propeller fold protein YncE